MSDSKPDEQFAQTLDVVVGPNKSTPETPPQVTSADPPPELIANRYRVGKIIGEGGFGMVYEAVDERLQKTVAIKLLVAKRSRNNKEFERFQHEALATSRLSHPNIVSVTDFDVLPDGRPFLVMEMVRGTSLDHVLSTDGKIPVPRAAAIARACCLALEAAHAQGIVHRDLKPSNVMVGTGTGVTGDIADVKVLDFGVAKLVRGTRTPTGLTQTGQILGTPSYMAPEQVRDRGEIDGRADIYAVGIILYEMLAGTPPFSGLSLTNVLVAKVTDKPQRPSKHDPSIPPDLEDIIMKAIHPDREKRFKTAAAMAEALEPFLLVSGANLRRRVSGRVIAAVIAVALAAVAVAAYLALRHENDGALFPAQPTTKGSTAGVPASDPAEAPTRVEPAVEPAVVPAVEPAVVPAVEPAPTPAAPEPAAETPPGKKPKRPPRTKPTEPTQALPDAPVERIRIPK
jgi:eukaryotic-like serine/threonine-protein kinase